MRGIQKLSLAFFMLVLFVPPVYAAQDYSIQGEYSVGDVLVKTPPGVDNQQLFAGRLATGQNASCGDIANAMNALGLNFQTSALQNLVKNWQQMGLPAALYFLGTSLPVVKEAIVGARTLSQFTGELAGQSCESIFKSIDRMNLTDSKLVQMCMNKKLGTGSHTEQDINNAYQYCLNPSNVSLVDLFAGDLTGLKKYLAAIDPQSFARCALGVGNQTYNVKPNPDGSYSSASLQRLPADSKFEFLAVNSLPSLSISGSSGALQLSTLKIDGQAVSFYQYLQMMQQNMQTDLTSLMDQIKSQSATPDQMQTAYTAFADRYNLSVPDIMLLVELMGDINQEVKSYNQNDPAYYVCSQNMALAEQNLNSVFFRKALDALKIGMLQKFNDLEEYAAKIGQAGAAYGCVNGTVNDISKEGVVDSIRRTKDNVMETIDTYEKAYTPTNVIEPCSSIAQSIRACLGTKTGEWINRYGALWLVGDNCNVTKITQQNSAGLAISAANLLDQLLHPAQNMPKGFVPGTVSLGFGNTALRLTALLLLIGAVILFGRNTIAALARDNWVKFAVNGFVLLIIISMMASLIFR